jgi:hypothetical protein
MEILVQQGAERAMTKLHSRGPRPDMVAAKD